MPFIHAIGTQINVANQAPQRVDSVHMPINVILFLTIIIIMLPDVVAILASHIGRCFDDAMKLSIKMSTKQTLPSPMFAFVFFLRSYFPKKFFDPTLTTKIPLPVIFLLQTG